MAKSFQCERCKNWYTPLNLDPSNRCWACENDAHARTKDGVVDCHYGHTSATKSEVEAVMTLQKVEEAKAVSLAVIERIRKSSTLEEAERALAEAEATLTAIRPLVAKLPDVVAAAGVFELPGRNGDKFNARYKNMPELEELVSQSRRPPEDLADMRRSDRNCREIADQARMLMESVTETVIEARMAVKSWTASAAPAAESEAVTAIPQKQMASCECGGKYSLPYGRTFHEKSRRHQEYARVRAAAKEPVPA